MNRYLKEIYLALLVREQVALSEKFPWTFPTGYKISLYFNSEWAISGFGPLGGAPVYLPTQNPVKAYLLQSNNIIECVVELKQEDE